MKIAVQLILAAFVLALLYSRPMGLVNFVNTPLGKVVGVVSIGVIATKFGVGAGILAGAAMIVLLETAYEGLDVQNKKSKKGVMSKKSTRAKRMVRRKKCLSDDDCLSVGGKCNNGLCRVAQKTQGTDRVKMEDQIKKGAERRTLKSTSETRPGIETPHTQKNGNPKEAFGNYF